MGPGDHRAVLRRRPRHRHRSRLRGAMGVRAVQAGRRRQADRGEARTDQLGQARGHGRDRAAVRVDHQRHDRRCRPACRPAKPDPAARSRRSPSCWAATSPRPRPSPASWPPPEALFAAVDILDSRYRDYRFALPDVIADNASAGRVVLASRPADLVDLRLVGCLLRAGGTVAATAARAVMEHPAVAVAWLANCLGPRGERLRAGWLVLSGGLTAPVPLEPGQAVTGRTGRAGFGGGLQPLGVIRFPAGAGWFG